ncbi:cellulose binding domain-containing protein [Micromonospora sp. DR5-3]|uniref:cellulose binding domain-containing protein n=1 Tax=unclassified Micromonospora TaxID=2617518 RepID=UPI0011D5E575|nr:MULTISPECIES: cellulose binding domain-containing protein [unclassified Micromonospora]MCW3820716.1 cellulose binding domain-containing protein [Micromonospora sp. DR5-3]TYC17226.1 hypothetical protein FXF52_39170 [Micromonospora sp. MP36]
MSAGRVQPAEEPSAPRLLMSVPWMVVLLGVGLLASLLVIALLAVRDEERRVMPTAGAPPIYLPTGAAESGSATPTEAAPLVAATPTATPTGSPSPSRSVGPSRSVSPTSGAPALAAPAPLVAPGAVTARYEAIDSDRRSFAARLTVTNGSGSSQDWTVELAFAGNVKSVEVSSGSGVSASSRGGGMFVLSGTGALTSGQSVSVQLQFGRTGTGDRPDRCTVNGADCAIG